MQAAARPPAGTALSSQHRLVTAMLNNSTVTAAAAAEGVGTYLGWGRPGRSALRSVA